MARLIIMLLALAVIAAPGADAQEVRDMADTSKFKVWGVDALVKILPDAPAPAKGTPIGVDAVRNEYESAQIVVTAKTEIKKLTVRLSPMTGPGTPTPRVEAHFLGLVSIKHGTVDTPPEHLLFKAPAQAPDPMLDSMSVSVGAGKNQSIWLTVYVPKLTPPGVYAGSVIVDADSATEEVPISVTVHPVTLPDARTLYLTNWFSTDNVAKAHNVAEWSEPYWKMLGAYARCMADHRQNVMITPIMELITGRDDGKGHLTFDFSNFDRWVELFEKAGVIGTIEGSHLAGRSEWEAKDFDASLPPITNPDGSPKPYAGAKVSSEAEKTFLSQFLPALQEHLEEKGWIDRYLQHLADEPIPANAESYKKLASYVREFAPKLKIIDACMCTEIAGAIDVWVPVTEHYDHAQKFYGERQKAGEEVWFYTCLIPKGKYMNRLIDYPLIDTRLLHWANFKYGVTGYLHWGLNYWGSDPINEIEPDWGGGTHLPPGDSHITYPGKRGPLSSVRFEALRDGAEDFELLKLLEKKDAAKAKAICGSVVRSLTDYTLDPAAFLKARMKLVEALTEE